MSDIEKCVYLILCKSRSNGVAAWWRPDERGYTSNVDEAGRYLPEHAKRIVDGCDDAVMVPERFVGKELRTRRIVDIGDSGNHQALNSCYGGKL